MHAYLWPGYYKAGIFPGPAMELRYIECDLRIPQTNILVGAGRPGGKRVRERRVRITTILVFDGS